MKITFINRLVAIAPGGGENLDLNLARALMQLGNEVQFVAGRRMRGIDVPLKEFPTTYIRTPYLRWLSYWGQGIAKRWALFLGGQADRTDSLLFEAMALERIVHSSLKESDVFQLCGLPRLAFWLEKRLKKPAVVFWPGPPGPLLGKWVGKYSANIANGEALDNARLFDPEVTEIQLGVDTAKFSSLGVKNERSKLGISSDAIVVLYVGRLIPIKNLPFLIQGFSQALESCPSLRLVLVGDGTEKAKVCRLVSQLGVTDKVIFAGWQPTDAVANFYRMADIFALTSSYDNFPNVVLEAMACELPVVATRVGGVPKQILDGVNGFLVESGDIEGLSQALVRLAESREMRRAMGEHNRQEVVRVYNWQASARELMKLHRRILK